MSGWPGFVPIWALISSSLATRAAVGGCEDPGDQEREGAERVVALLRASEEEREARQERDRHADPGSHRGDQDVVVRHVRQLVGQHPAELALVAELEDALRHRDGRVMG